MAVILKSPGEIEAMKAAGQLSAEVLRKVGELVKPGVSTLELDEFAETYIRERGGIPAFKVNEQIVHGIPSKNVVLRDGDILSVDTGATVDGWVGDNAWTFAVGKISEQKRKLLKVTEKCMWAGLDCAVAGNHLGDIGHAVQSIAENAGYGVVREYVGHGVGRNMHEEPNVPNYGHRHLGMRLQVGMVLAIEPMINMGTRKVLQGKDGWLVSTRDGKPSAHFEKMVAITEDGPVIITTEPDHKRPL